MVRIGRMAMRSTANWVPQPRLLEQVPSKKSSRILDNTGGNSRFTTGLSTVLQTKHSMGDDSFIDLSVLILNMLIVDNPQ